MRTKLVILIGLTLLTSTFGQASATVGTLLRIDLTKTEIDLNDTLWHWTNQTTSVNTGSSEICVSANKIGQTQYLSTQLSVDDLYRPMNHTFLYNCSTKSSKLIVEDFPLIDPAEFWYYTPIIKNANNGAWYFYGKRRAALFVRHDSLYDSINESTLTPIHYCGKSGNSDLVIVKEIIGTGSYYYLYTADLSRSPKIILGRRITVESSGVGNHTLPEEIYSLNDSLVVLRNSSDLALGLFDGYKIRVLKRITPLNSTQLDFRQWHFSGDNLFYVEQNKLYQQKYDYNSQSYQGRTILVNILTYPYTYSSDNQYFAYISNDSLKVYSFAEQKVNSTYSIKSINHLGAIILDWPYLYLHRTSATTTQVVNAKELPAGYSLSQNYPNPFNPSTRISYSVPSSGRLSIIIYDALGRKAATLIDGEKAAGIYSIDWSAGNFPSGIYFCQMRSADFVEIRKMIIVK